MESPPSPLAQAFPRRCVTSFPPNLQPSILVQANIIAALPVGFDLQGNTFWEFRLTTRGPGSQHDPSVSTSSTASDPGERWRRIVKYPRSTHYSSVKVSPLWHQWLRYTRHNPPSLEEQREDVVRQVRMKQLAAEADARWEAKPRVMEAGDEKPRPALSSTSQAQDGSGKEDATKKKQVDTEVDPKDPWKKARASGPGETWQPSAWTPTGNKS